MVVAALVSIYLRTTNGSGPASDFEPGDIALLAILAVPSLMTELIARNWRIWWAECVLAVLAWGFFLGPGGDLSCTDCGFAVFIPIYIAVPQLIVLITAWLVPSMRQLPK